MSFAVQMEKVIHRYGERVALDGVSFAVPSGEIFGLVGPNGGGKSTCFQIICTLIRPTAGTVRIFGEDLATATEAARQKIGVVFQNPALDKKLTVAENLLQQGHLYGLRGPDLKARANKLLERLGLLDRSRDYVEKLSGGLKRRLEIAKGLLHHPPVLILDEPTTGLDPAVRRDVWEYLLQLQRDEGMTILVTTHLLDEAENCDLIVFLDQGKIVAEGSPEALKKTLGGDVISVRTRAPEPLAQAIQAKFRVSATVVDGMIRLEKDAGAAFIPQLVEAFPQQIDSVTVGKPTLEDLFIQKTGRRLEADAEVRT